MKRILKLITTHEIARYIIVGGCTTAVNFLAFGVMYNLLHINVTISNTASIILSIIFAYVTNRSIVFQVKVKGFAANLSEFVKFFGSRVGTMLLEIAGVYFIAEILKADPMVGKMVMQVFVLVSNYIISKFFVFK